MLHPDNPIKYPKAHPSTENQYNVWNLILCGQVFHSLCYIYIYIYIYCTHSRSNAKQRSMRVKLVLFFSYMCVLFAQQSCNSLMSVEDVQRNPMSGTLPISQSPVQYPGYAQPGPNLVQETAVNISHCVTDSDG